MLGTLRSNYVVDTCGTPACFLHQLHSPKLSVVKPKPSLRTVSDREAHLSEIKCPSLARPGRRHHGSWPNRHRGQAMQ